MNLVDQWLSNRAKAEGRGGLTLKRQVMVSQQALASTEEERDGEGMMLVQPRPRKRICPDLADQDGPTGAGYGGKSGLRASNGNQGRGVGEGG